jgi:glycerophosphoryl diester phosphodiesterase
MTALSRATRTLAALLVTAALGATFAASAPAQTVDGDGNPITNDAGVRFGILSHRGGAAQWPQNSVEAYQNSVAAGFDTIETDIVFTKDGHGVMSHYDTLPSRCTHAGSALHTMTLAQVSQVRCEDLSGQKVVPIPTFEQLAEALSADPAVGLTLDIKTYASQTAAGKRSWASKAIGLVKSHGLLARTSIITFSWKYVLPTIRSIAPKLYVLALDGHAADFDRARLADRLGASGYGVKMRNTTVYFAQYVKSLGMDSTPWEVLGSEQLAFWIHYGGKVQMFSTDTPAETRASLLAGDIDLNPVGTPVTTTLAAPATISRRTYTAKHRHYPVVGTSVVPSSALPMLNDVTLSVTVTGGTGKGSLYVKPASAPGSATTRIALPKGTAKLTVHTTLGDARKLRVYTTATVKLTIQVVAYSRMRFA